MKFERESDGSYQRTAVEVDRWVERAIAFMLISAVGGGGVAVAVASLLF
jgi:hypothetical protein